MARGDGATKFFTGSLKGSILFFSMSLVGDYPDSFDKILPTMAKFALATLIASLLFNPLLVETLKSYYLGVIKRMHPSYCCVVASTILVIYDTLSKTDNIICLKMLPLVCICMLSAVPLVCDRDHSGMTEGILIASGKWFIINSMAFPWWRSAVCGLVMAYSIFALFTSVGEPFRGRTDDGPPLKRNVYFTGESQKDRKKSVIVLRLFYVCSLVIKYTGGVAVVWYTYKFLLGYTTSPALLSLGMLSSIACFAGGITVFKKVVTGFIKYQQSKEERRWFLAVGIMGLCEAFLDENDILPLIMISGISMFIICVITTGWDYDRSGVSDGLLMTYMQWTTLSLFNSKSSWQSVISGLTLSFVVASKFTGPLEPALEKES